MQSRNNAVEALQQELDQNSLNTKLQTLKGLDLSNASVNVWLTEVKPSNANKRFTKVKQLNVHSNHEHKFKQYVLDCINGNDHIDELRPITTNQDNRFFYLESSSTDLSQLIDIIANTKILEIKEEKELNEFNSYVIQLTFGSDDQSIFAFRYISGAWSVNKTSGSFLDFKMFDNEFVAEIKVSKKFQITPYIDFIQYNDDVFIADLKQFETAMNYHERLKEKKVQAVEALSSSHAMNSENSKILANVIGTDKRLMRQLASVHEKKYYANEVWLQRLKKAADEAGNWQIKFDSNNNIIVENNKYYVKEMLTLLQNKRVKTVVDGLMFDVEGELIEIPTGI
ncbi:Kiwa anti-phage protein KwaB-like domain-containing protein [Photobacterium leiognathi]|uniref:Kiwa anti-phage protein KwaB-like domain-containing protein n=1 Tax=Photobacterium leiognathi TaxID=553611 RepID=UPI002980B160|nr:Kiwa anti-phage protein KwaB-like domain-containing protein [Photobacterium leiognathi]